MRQMTLMLLMMMSASCVAAKERIIALAPHLTEMVYALGAGDQIVGVMKFSDYPEAAKKLPVIGDAYALNYESIVALKPTLVLAWAGGTPQKQIDKLRSLRLKVVALPTHTVKDIASNMRIIAGDINAPDDSMRVIQQFEQDMAALQARYSHTKPVKVFYELWPQPLMTVGHQHPISEAIGLCGGVNVFNDIKSSAPTVSQEALRVRKPALLLSAAGDSEHAMTSTAQTLLPNTPAVKLTGDFISRMGPRFVMGVKQLCEAIDKVRNTTQQVPR